MKNCSEALLVTGSQTQSQIVSVSQLASCFSFPKGNMNFNTSASCSQGLSSLSLSSAVLGSHTLSRNSSSSSLHLYYIGITVPDRVPSDE